MCESKVGDQDKEKKLKRAFFRRSADDVAKDLLGKNLVRKSLSGKTVGKIVETEAYLGKEDPASHTYKGKRTERNEILFGPPGHAYVYLIYGMYHCFNIITGKEGKSEGVFIRALEPVQGTKLMKERREKEDKSELTNGPGKLCMAMDIDKGLDGEDITGDKLYVTRKVNQEKVKIIKAKRVNIDYAGEAKEWKLRFLIENNPFVSEPPG